MSYEIFSHLIYPPYEPTFSPYRLVFFHNEGARGCAHNIDIGYPTNLYTFKFILPFGQCIWFKHILLTPRQVKNLYKWISIR